ncbi:HipA domain-containing protein [Dubosiella newyorkensis]|nr:HipA domain-containing protein [Dubosiella newyorkensis]
MNTIDLNQGKEVMNIYGGSERKKRFLIDGKYYLVKFPDPVREVRRELSYMNNQFSEYIGCHVFESIGIPVQKTYLGEYEWKGKKLVVVACEDFQNLGLSLNPIARIELSDLDSNLSGKSRTISSLYETIKSLPSPELRFDVRKRFWEIFVVDSLIGNYDRHMENWGLAETQDGTIIPAPVYDCGSCLHPLYTVQEMSDYLLHTGQLRNIAYNMRSQFSEEKTGRTLRFIDVYENADRFLKQAILDVFPRIDLTKIYKIIQATPFLDEPKSKQFMFETLKIRYNQILLKEYVKLKYRDLTPDQQKAMEKRIKSNNNISLKRAGYIPLAQSVKEPEQDLEH